ncbi:MAG: response regulator transcription factor [Verrucomicrobia bacterium]|nr:response regulator transcription factor [Verrucomicrobiota bacterium]
MRTVIVEDQPMCRDLIRIFCGTYLRHEIVGEANDEPEALEVIRRTRSEVVFLDLHLGAGNGFAVAEKLALELPQVRCILMTGDCSERTLLCVERAPVAGFIDKNIAGVHVFKAALEAVAAGRKYYSPSYDEARRRCRANPHSFDKLLTDREQEVLKLIGCMMTDPEIADHLGLAVTTVETHRRNLLSKLDLPNTRKLIKYAIEHGLTGFVNPIIPAPNCLA